MRLGQGCQVCRDDALHQRRVRLLRGVGAAAGGGWKRHCGEFSLFRETMRNAALTRVVQRIIPFRAPLRCFLVKVSDVNAGSPMCSRSKAQRNQKSFSGILYALLVYKGPNSLKIEKTVRLCLGMALLRWLVSFSGKM
jgi:hypothetical protein